MSTDTKPDSQHLDLSHLQSKRAVLKWCYDHGLLKGEFPDADSSGKQYLLDEAERRLSELDEAYVQERETAAQLQFSANLFARFKEAMIKQDLSARPPEGARFRTPLEELSVILAGMMPELSHKTNREEYRNERD